MAVKNNISKTNVVLQKFLDQKLGKEKKIDEPNKFVQRGLQADSFGTFSKLPGILTKQKIYS